MTVLLILSIVVLFDVELIEILEIYGDDTFKFTYFFLGGEENL